MPLKKLIINIYSAMYCMLENYTNSLPLQTGATGDSNPDIDGVIPLIFRICINEKVD